MGGMCARVCPTEILCEGVCVRNTQDENPVRIGDLQRYATDWFFERGETLFERAKPTGKSIAIVGGGPAGLACAHRLAVLGHDSTIFEAKEIEVERSVILQEIGQTLDTPDDVIFDWLQETAYPNQALGRSILGPSEQVSNFNRHNLISFIKEHYRPERMILSAAGAVDHSSVVKFAENTFPDHRD